MGKVAVLLKGRARPGKRDAIQRLFEEHLAPRALANAAQEIVVWCADSADADAFYLWEVYGDPSAMEANGRAPWFGEYMAQVQPLLAGMPEMITATPLWMKPTASQPG